MKPYEEMTRWELWEAMQDAGEMKDGRSMRKIHKCLKKYNDGDHLCTDTHISR